MFQDYITKCQDISGHTFGRISVRPVGTSQRVELFLFEWPVLKPSCRRPPVEPLDFGICYVPDITDSAPVEGRGEEAFPGLKRALCPARNRSKPPPAKVRHR